MVQVGKQLIVVILCCLLAVPAQAALPATGEWEIRSTATASNVNGCAFATGASGMDFSQQDAPQATTTAATVVNAVTTIIDVDAGDYTVTANDVGNFFHETGGTATDGWYHITAVDTMNNQWTVDRAIGSAGQTVVGRMGGACNALNSTLLNVFVASNHVWIKDQGAAYAVAAAITNVNASDYLQISGYTTTRGDCDKPTLQATAGSITMLTISNASGDGLVTECLIFDGNGQASIAGVAGTGGFKTWRNLEFDDFASTAVAIQSGTAENILITNQRGGSAVVCSGSNSKMSNIVVLDPAAGASHTFNLAANSQCFGEWLVAEERNTANTNCYLIGSQSGSLVNSVCYNAGNFGFAYTCGSNCGQFTVLNSIVDTAATACFGVSGAASAVPFQINYNGVFCTTNYSGISAGPNDVDLSASPFVSAGSDYALNNTAGGGAALKNVGFPGTTSAGEGFMSIGTYQPQGTGGVRVYGGFR